MQPLKEISVQFIKGVGPAKKKLFEKLGVETVEDLLYLFPRRYEDRTRMTPLSQVKPGETLTVSGQVLAQGARQSWYTRKHVYEMAIGDGHGRLCVVWFNQPYLNKYFSVGTPVVLYGRVELYKDRLQMVSPEYEIIDKDDDLKLNMGRIVPVYPLTRGFSQRTLRKVMYRCLDNYLPDLPDILPVWVRNKYRLPNIRRSLAQIHFPESTELQENAHRRVSFEEFFLFQISVIKRRMTIVRQEGYAHRIGLDFISQFVRMFPFPLTGAQQRVIREIAGDMQQPSPMMRLLHGDVGSGKTVVALFGCLAAVVNGAQAALMAPTEILARQHYESIVKFLAGGPFADVPVELLVSGLPKKPREEVVRRLQSGESKIVVGTHALLSEDIRFRKLSYVVIDEQHKFGVRQRALLSSKGTSPDVLVMTATPIPRTLSLTLFGDLDVSVLDEMPKNRGGIVTEVFSSENAEEVYRRVKEKVLQGEQAYIIYPIIEASEKLNLKAARAMFERFQTRDFKDLNLGLVHGQMKRARSDEVLVRFKNKELHILVATTVLEVGIDVPHANIMVIEHAEYFGLAQLHQLRGRVGRGQKNGFCYLIADPSTDEGRARLEAIRATTDGFKIAEQDLLIRGPGQYFGRHQHGLNELRFANPATQIDILELARKEAQEVTHRDPDLVDPRHIPLGNAMKERYPTYLSHIQAG